MDDLAAVKKRNDDVRLADRDADIIQYRMVNRFRPTKIAALVGCSLGTVQATIHTYVMKMREQLTDMIAERYHEQDELIETLITQSMAQLQKQYDVNIVRVLVMLMDRQARLHGLDARLPGKDAKRWLETSSDAEIIETAKRLGLKVDEPMDIGIS